MIYWSEIDEKRFGLKTAKLSVCSAFPGLQSELNVFKANKGQLFIVRCDASLNETIFQLQQAGFFLVDTMLTFSLSREGLIAIDTPKEGVEVFVANSSHKTILNEIAAEAFSNYRGHYHNNPALSKTCCDEVYIDWAGNLVTRPNMADAVFISKVNGKYAGFASLKASGKRAKAGLLGIIPEFQGEGLSRVLHHQRFQWCIENGVKEILVETSLNNTKYINILFSMGYSFISGTQIFHLNNF